MEKIIFITGANNGIRFKTAKKSAEKGINVILGCKNLEKGKKAVEDNYKTSLRFPTLDDDGPNGGLFHENDHLPL